jgi:hypothetical protein
MRKGISTRALLGTSQDSEKWKVIEKESPPKRGALTKMDDDDEEEGDGPRNKNKPDGNKKAKDKIKKETEASSLREKLDDMVKSNEILVIKTLEAKKELPEKKAQEAMWCQGSVSMVVRQVVVPMVAVKISFCDDDGVMTDAMSFGLWRKNYV